MVVIPPPTESMDQIIEKTGTVPGQSTGRKLVDVFVTGFGPFRKITDNPSFKIAQELPSELLIGGDNGIEIKIVHHPKPVHVAFQTVLDLIPKLYDQYSSRVHPYPTRSEAHEPPFIIHIGAGHSGEYAAEERAHRDGYSHIDVDGKAAPLQPNADAETENRGYPIFDEYAAEELVTGIDLQGVVDDVDGEIADLTMPINTSEDAGRFLCDFIYYTSLHEAVKRWGPGGLKRVLFVHVPPDGTLEEGIRVLTAIIRAVVRRSQ